LTSHVSFIRIIRPTITAMFRSHSMAISTHLSFDNNSGVTRVGVTRGGN